AHVVLKFGQIFEEPNVISLTLSEPIDAFALHVVKRHGSTPDQLPAVFSNNLRERFNRIRNEPATAPANPAAARNRCSSARSHARGARRRAQRPPCAAPIASALRSGRALVAGDAPLQVTQAGSHSVQRLRALRAARRRSRLRSWRQ